MNIEDLKCCANCWNVTSCDDRPYCDKDDELEPTDNHSTCDDWLWDEWTKNKRMGIK